MSKNIITSAKRLLAKVTLLTSLPLGGLGWAFCCTLTSCSDFFDTDPNNVIDDKDYIDKEDEIYKGMLGIMTRMQEAGDQSIWLTDTRCNFLETTAGAPDALKAIYNYDATDGNEYADPTCYYAIVIACNDYIHKMEQYHRNVGGMSEGAETNFRALLSSALRIKVWAYYTLGRIYGEAYWFDDPLTEMKSLTDTSIFTRCDMQQLTEHCIALLDGGISVDGLHIPADLEMQWYTWLDSENLVEANYYKWQYLTPPFLLLRAELVSWRCSYLSEEAAQADWLWIRDTLLKYMYEIHTGAVRVTNIDPAVTTDYLGFTYQTGIPLQSDARDAYNNIFCSEEVGNKWQLVSGIMYDYNNHQRNRLVQYLCPAYPSTDAFYLQPSEYGLNNYAETDIRSLTQRMVVNEINGTPAVTKYYYSYNYSEREFKYLRENIFEIEPTIITFRGHDFHFLLAEAENHLGNWQQARAILNMGLTNEFSDRDGTAAEMPEGWSQYYTSWFGGNGGYGDVGIVGAARGTVYDLPTPADDGYALTETQRRQVYDWAIAREHTKEYVAEGKSYSYLCKMAERYSNGGRGDKATARQQVADIIVPKYPADLQPKVRSSLQNQGYFIQWNL